jgi:cyanophycinase
MRCVTSSRHFITFCAWQTLIAQRKVGICRLFATRGPYRALQLSMRPTAVTMSKPVILLTALALSGPFAAWSQPALTPTTHAKQPLAGGCAMAIGGALQNDNVDVWSRLVTLAGGPGARFVVLATAAGNPEQSGARLVETLNRYGAKAEALPIAPQLPNVDVQAAVRDEIWIAKVKAASGVFFSGGDQIRITSTLLEKDGRDTPLLAAIREVKARGGVVAGTSAGAAIMSPKMFIDVPDVLGALQQGMKVGRDLGSGLGFIDRPILIDQHFLKRGRIGRLLPAMRQLDLQLGLGVEENTAAIVCGDALEVVGARGALWVDLPVRVKPAKPAKPSAAFGEKGIRLTYLDRGDKMNLTSREVTVSEAKRAGNVLDPATGAAYRPYHAAVPFYADILGDNVIATAMGTLIDSKASEAKGLAFRPSGPGVKQPELGFEFRLYKGPGTKGYFTSALGGENYSVMQMYLDVTPVKMPVPLYRAIP